MAQKQKILIVEDDALIGADLHATLTEYGYSVLGPITSGEEVLKEITSLAPHFVLMDINLAGKLDGIQTAEALQKIISVPVVFLSALNDEGTLQRAKLVNPFGYLIKPFDGPELRSTIELTLHRFSNQPQGGTASGVAHAEEDAEEILSEDSPSSEHSVRFLSKLPVFKDIPTSAIQQLCQSSSIRECDAGEFLILEGEETEGVFIPISGRISVTKTADSGKELIVALLAPGDAFGLFYTLPAFASSTSARTQIPSKVIWIPISEWSYFAERAPQVYKNLANGFAERLSAAHTLSSSLAHARVEGRIINTLIALLPDFGKSTNKSGKEDRIFITRKELSELTGTTPETAIRVTKNLEREGMLDLTRPGIIKIPSVEALKNLLNN